MKSSFTWIFFYRWNHRHVTSRPSQHVASRRTQPSQIQQLQQNLNWETSTSHWIRSAGMISVTLLLVLLTSYSIALPSQQAVYDIGFQIRQHVGAPRRWITDNRPWFCIADGNFSSRRVTREIDVIEQLRLATLVALSDCIMIVHKRDVYPVGPVQHIQLRTNEVDDSWSRWESSSSFIYENRLCQSSLYSLSVGSYIK